MASRIAYLVPQFPAQTHAFFWREIQGLRKAGAEVSLYSTQTPPSQDKGSHAFIETAKAETTYLYPLNGTVAVKGILKHPAWLFRAIGYALALENLSAKERFKSLAFVFLAASLLEHLLSTKTLHIHGHSCADTGHILAICGLHPKISYSLTLHGNLSVYGKNHKQKMQQAKFVSPVTKPLQKELEQIAQISPDRAPVIWMGVDMGKFEVTPAPPVTDQFQIITVARLNSVKGHTYALQAVESLISRGQRVHYTIVGGGEMREHLEKEVEQRGLRAHVTFTGSLSEDHIRDLLKASHALVLSSFGHGEAAPVCVMEAMASGRPVVCSLIGGTGDMIANGETGYLVPQKDVSALVSSLEKLIHDESIRTQIGANARKFAEQQFDSRRQAEKLLAAIEAQ